MLYAQFIVNGLITGAYVSLVAAGFSLIYATNKFAHFAHGAVVAAGAYILYTFFSIFGLNFYVSAVLAVLSTGFLGVLFFKLVYTRLKARKASSAILLIASLALMILIENVLLAVFGPNVRTLGFLSAQKGILLWGVSITPLQIIIIATSVALLTSVWVFVRYSKLGKLMRAVADNPELASTTGINAGRIQTYSFFIGSALAAIAAILIGLEQNITPHMGTNLIIKGFAGAVVGGIHSLPGAVLGSYILGLAENLGVIWLPSGYKEAITFMLLLIFLIVRPQGILGVKRGVR